MTLFLALVVAALASLVSVPAQSQAAKVPEDPRQSWVVGICSLTTFSLEARHLYLAHSIPLLLQERLLPADTHRLTGEERQAYRRHLLDAEIRSLSAILIRNRRQRDEVYARPIDDSARERELGQKDAQIRLLTDEIRALQILDPERIEVADLKPVEFARAQGSGPLLAAPEFSPYRRAASAGVDLLIFGRIEQVSEYLFIKIQALDYPGGRVVYSYEDALESTEVYTALDELAGALAGIILGREWATLSVHPAPASASVFVDGEFAGAGETVVPYAEPGLRVVDVRRRGYEPQRITVSLESGESSELEVSLRQSPLGELTISSIPYDASIYIDSLWVGRTPSTVSRSPDISRALVLREGYREQAIRLSATVGAVEAILSPGFISPEEGQRQGKNGFYAALGIWAVSLPIPVFAWAISLDYAAAFRSAELSAGVAEQVRLARLYTASYAVYVGGLIVNLGLLANMLMGLLEYIEAADRPAG